ncbi:MAG: aspartyl protease family protein [Prevotellaceae bacterium]|jgi:hypothetical protein|nr:aspartyl protease family protein [Prevotellaceae bacterium]
MQEQNTQQVHALTSSKAEIADSIVTPVEIENMLTGQALQTAGIWDTGATGSVITKSTAAALALLPINRARVRGVHGAKEVNVYFVKITLNNRNITLTAQVTECDELSADNSVGMLIGMNIITMGDFAVTSYLGQTTMSFRVPSLQKIDFVAEMRAGTQQNEKKQ